MVAGVCLEGGKYTSVVVRYAPKAEGLYTTVDVLKQKGVEPQDVIGASAPIKVYDGVWSICGMVPDDSFFAESRLVRTIPFIDCSWNFK